MIMSYDNSAVKGTTPEDRRRLLSNGYEPIPIHGKAPRWSWRGVEITDELLGRIEADRPDHTGTGLRTGRLSVADVDLVDPDHAEAAQTAIHEVMGHTPLVRVGRKGAALCYRNEDPMGKVTVTGRAPGADRVTKLVEFLGTGQQVAAYGIHPDTGRPYEWPMDWNDGEPLVTPLAALPEVTPDKIRAAAIAVTERLAELGFLNLDVTEAGARDEDSGPSAASGEPVTVDMLRGMLSAIHPSCERRRVEGAALDPRDLWLKVGAAIKSAHVVNPETGEEDETHDGLELFTRWSGGELHGGEPPDNYDDPQDCAKAYDSLKVDRPGGAGVGSLIFLARANGYAADTRHRGTGEDQFGDIEAEDHAADVPGDNDRDEERRRAGIAAIEAKTYVGGAIFGRGKAREFLIPGWLPGHGIVAMNARRGAGKTVTAIDLALRIASDMDWHGAPIREDLDVIYMCGEDDEGAEAFVQAWCLANGVTEPPERFAFVDGIPPLSDPGEAGYWAEFIRRRRASRGDRRTVVLLDTWQRGTAGLRLNEHAEMTTAMEVAETIGEAAGGPVIGLFHPPKHDGRTLSGGGVQENMTVAIWTGDDDAPDCDFKLECSRLKGGKKGELHRLNWTEVQVSEDDGFGSPETSIVATRVGGTEAASAQADHDAGVLRDVWEIMTRRDEETGELPRPKKLTAVAGELKGRPRGGGERTYPGTRQGVEHALKRAFLVGKSPKPALLVTDGDGVAIGAVGAYMAGATVMLRTVTVEDALPARAYDVDPAVKESNAGVTTLDIVRGRGVKEG